MIQTRIKMVPISPIRVAYIAVHIAPGGQPDQNHQTWQGGGAPAIPNRPMCVLCGAGPHAQGVRMRYPVSRAVLGPHSWGRPSPATVHASPRGFLRLIGTPYARARVPKLRVCALKPACACPVRSVCLMCKNSGRRAPTGPCRMRWAASGPLFRYP